jgi:hypothetical protein
MKKPAAGGFFHSSMAKGGKPLPGILGIELAFIYL